MGRSADAENLANGITGLVGDNGVGKSVLLALAAGTLEPATGTVARQGRLHAVSQHLAGGTVAALAGIADVLAALARLEVGQGDEADLLMADGRWALGYGGPLAARAGRRGSGPSGLTQDAKHLSGASEHAWR